MISLISLQPKRGIDDMANLIVRNLDPTIVTALKRRATQHGRSAEAEHRILLETALLQPPRRSFAQALAAIPNAGRDEDFARVDDRSHNTRVFG
jgi:antitoxin FitA